jgi:hypothetical protein
VDVGDLFEERQELVVAVRPAAGVRSDLAVAFPRTSTPAALSGSESALVVAGSGAVLMAAPPP